jgi:UvrD-like helicase C-terminal domain
LRLTGCGPSDSRIGKISDPRVVLCRGNADAMQEVLAFLELGVPVALTGGGDAMQRVAKAAMELKAGQRTSHPELFLFTSWAEVQDYVEHDKAGQDLKAIVKLVDEYGPDQIIHAVERLSDEANAKVTVSTAHKAKGREWDSVRIGGGFTDPSVDDEGSQRGIPPAEARLIYVAVTRARRLLDLTGIAWVDEYEKITAGGRPPLATLSLTGQLRHDDSPVSQFMAQHLPSSLAVQRDYVARLAGLPYPVQPIDVQRPDWAALGHAIDYRLRLSFGATLGPAVSHGLALLDGYVPGAPVGSGLDALIEAGERLLATVDAYLTNPGSLTEDAVIRLCFVASFFEDIYRTGQDRSAASACSPGQPPTPNWPTSPQRFRPTSSTTSASRCGSRKAPSPRSVPSHHRPRSVARSLPEAATSRPTPITSSKASYWTAKPPRTRDAWAVRRSTSSPVICY